MADQHADLPATDETDSEANTCVERLITQHLHAGDLVFDRHIAQVDLDENYDAIYKVTSAMLDAVEPPAAAITPLESQPKRRD